MAGRRANLALLVTSTVVLAVAVALTALPDYTARLIASWGGQVAMEDSMNGPGGTTTHPAAGPATSGEGEAGMPGSVTLQVDGMTCGSWPLVVERALAGLPGIKKAEVSFEEGRARVTYDPSEVTAQQMVEAIHRVGFVARQLPSDEGGADRCGRPWALRPRRSSAAAA